MYPNGLVQPSATDALGGVFASIVTGGLLGLLVVGLVLIVGWYILYRVVRSAVRDGMVDANRKTGGGVIAGGGGYVNGWPPEQQVSAPAAPVYRGPNG